MTETSKVILLRQVIGDILHAVHPEVWYENASDKAQYPYLVYNLPNSVDNGDTEIFVLDVDAWDADQSRDTIGIEALIDAADRVLNGRVVTLDNLSFRILRDRRLSPKDDDKRIVRRTYIYQVRTFERRGRNG